MVSAPALPRIRPYLTQRTLPLPRPTVDVSAWLELSIEQMGSKPKVWLEGPEGARWLFKPVPWNTQKDGSRYLRGDDWSEVIATELGRALGLATATVELAVSNGEYGVISRSLARGAGLVHGNEVLSGRDPAYRNDTRWNPRYTVEAVMDVMRSVGPPPDMYLPATSVFAGYLVLDALVGNTDRHHENWALLRRFRGPQLLAPTFDHASSLGFLLDNAERAERLTTNDRNRDVAAYAARARTPFADARSPLEAALRALAALSPRECDRWHSGVEQVHDDFAEIVRSVPDTRLSVEARTFVSELLELNRRALMDAMERLG